MTIIEEYVKELSLCCEELAGQSSNLEKIADIIYGAYKQGGQVFILGNGGSATTATHFARDLSIGGYVKGKRKIKVCGLADNIAMITSIANDVNYESIFEQQLIGRLEKGDVVIAISCSGNSPNVLKAVEFARSSGAVTIGFTGFGGGKLRQIVDKAVVFSSRDFGPLEDIHLGLGHLLSYMVRKRIEDEK